MSRRVARAGGLLFAAWCSLVSAQQTGLPAEETPAQLLTRMSNSVHYLDYEGSIVYLREGVMDAVRLSHTEQDGYEREHLIALTGAAHQIVRDNYTVTRFQPGRSVAAVEDRGLNALGSTLRSFDPERVARSYDFEEREAERVAGRTTRAIAIMPRDDLRFGYLLHIDAKYALPLKFDVLDGDESVSQLMFTDIRIRHESPEAILAATEQNSGLVPVPREPYAGEWHFDQLPPGFKLEFMEVKDGTEHFVFSDGMATMSVYVENDRSAGLEGQQRLGAFGAYGGEVAGHQVTVVGEMPLDSLRMVWSGVRRGAGDSAGG